MRGLFDGLPMRLLLAALSGVACGVFVTQFPELDFVPLDFGLPGFLFGAAVLWPHLEWRRAAVARALALILASALSFWSAMNVTLGVGSWLGLRPFGLVAFMLGSLVGAAIVLVAARFLIPLKTAARYWLLGAGAALAGGAVMYLGIEALPYEAAGITGFAIWHALVCLALHLGSLGATADQGSTGTAPRPR